MIQYDWFEEDPEEEFSDAQRSFLGALRNRAQTWPCDPEDTQIVVPEDGSAPWCAALFVNSQIGNLELLSVGVCFDGASIRAGQIHNQCFYPYPEEKSKVAVLEATGDPQHLAKIAADWFEQVMARPVEKHEWQRDGRTWCRYVFSDTGTGICSTGFGDFRTPADRVISDRGPRPGEILYQRENFA